MNSTLLLCLVASAALAAPKKSARPPKPTPPAVSAPGPEVAPAPPPSAPVSPPAEAEPAPAPPAPKVEAAPAPVASPGERPRLSVLDLTAPKDVDPQVVAGLSEAIAQEASQLGTFLVTSQRDLMVLLGVERERQLLGCNDDTSCVTELAQAAGARFVLSGTLARLGSTWQLTVQTMDTSRATAIGRATRLASELDTLRAQLPWVLAEATGAPPPRSPSRVLPYSLLIGGGVALAASGVLFLQSFTREEATLAELNVAGALVRTNTYYQQEAAQISQLRIIASVVGGLGAAALVAGLVLNPKSDAVVRVAVVPAASGAALVGVFP